jgi:hypothetical protein
MPPACPCRFFRDGPSRLTPAVAGRHYRVNEIVNNFAANKKQRPEGHD